MSAKRKLNEVNFLGAVAAAAVLGGIDRAALPVPKALAIMRADLGTAFDPACFAALEQALDRMSTELKAVA